MYALWKRNDWQTCLMSALGLGAINPAMIFLLAQEFQPFPGTYSWCKGCVISAIRVLCREESFGRAIGDCGIIAYRNALSPTSCEDMMACSELASMIEWVPSHGGVIECSACPLCLAENSELVGTVILIVQHLGMLTAPAVTIIGMSGLYQGHLFL